MTSSAARQRSTQAVISPSAEDSIFQNVSLPAGLKRKDLSKFGDDIWDLTPMANKATVRRLVVDVTTFPAPFRQTAKRIAWAMINERTPVEALERTTAIKERLSAGSVSNLVSPDIRPWLEWLDARGVKNLASVTPDDFRAYANEMKERGAGRDRKKRMLFSVSRIWLLAPYLPPADRLKQPTWERVDEESPDSMDALLGPANWSAENKTTPVHPQTMSQLLMCAMTFTNEFADDIINAKNEKARLLAGYRKESQEGDRAILRKYLQGVRRRCEALPGFASPGRRDKSKPELAKQYLAVKLGIGYNTMTKIDMTGLTIGVGARLDTSITGSVDGIPWTSAIDFYEVDRLTRRLATACYLVVGYLLGQRPEETRGLERGCCRPTKSSGPTGYRVYAKTYKGVLDKDGNTVAGGEEREQPWLGIEPVARAIAVVEALSTSDLLFPGEIFLVSPGTKQGPNIAVSAKTLSDTTVELTNWWNSDSRANNRRASVIPSDPEGMVTPQRLRRTLAWFIYRLPGGRIALGVQYGHLRGMTTDGYGSRVSSGLRDVFPMEEAYAAAEQLQDDADALEEGVEVSGKAADRYINGVRTYQETFSGLWLTPKQAAALRRDPRLRIFENGKQCLACVYDQKQALCHPDRDKGKATLMTSPDPSRCQPACGNIARTDLHIKQVKAEIVQLKKNAESLMSPEPMRQRDLQHAESLQKIVADHRANRKKG